MLLRAATICLLALEGLAQQAVVSFDQSEGAFLLAGNGSSPRIYVDEDDWYGVQRAATDLALDFGRVTGHNGTFITTHNLSDSSGIPTIIAGTIGTSSTIDALISNGQIDAVRVQGQWEAYQIQLLRNVSGLGEALVIVGADKRGTIFGIYDVSEQIGVSPWYWWADVGVQHQDTIYALNVTKVQGSPSVKYRGIFLNDEQPGLSNWVRSNYPDVEYGAGFTHQFYSTVFELLLRLRANYIWPAMWGSMFYIDDSQNARVADEYGIVMGTSHTEPMARATNEQGNSRYIEGAWAWDTNQANVTDFMRKGAERAKPYETLFTLGMRGHGDVASPTLTAASLEEIVHTQQQLLRDVYNTTNLTGIPQMWCLYKEVANYYADGLEVPDDVTLLWSEDNWGNAQRLSYGNETERSGGSGIYYHVDYVGDPRDYKWINTASLQKSWSELQQAYARGAQRIWILNVGDLKPLEVPIHHFLDMAYDIERWSSPNSTNDWLTQWSSKSFGKQHAVQTAEILSNYSMYAARRKYELLDLNTYSLINYEEASQVLGEWSDLVNAAQQIHDALPSTLQAAFFETVLHPAKAGQLMHQIHINIAKNRLYGEQGRTSTNALSEHILDLFMNGDYDLTQQYHTLLNGKWDHILSQTHLGYQYWQQPMRNSLPPISYVQTRQISAAGALGVTCEANNGTVPGDDKYHDLSSNVLTLPPMDPYMSSQARWIDVFSRGVLGVPVSFNVSVSHPAVKVSPHAGILLPNGTLGSGDRRLYVSVDWSLVTNRTDVATINITTTGSDATSSDFVNGSLPYGNFNMPQIMLPLNKTSIAEKEDFSGFVESDAYVSMEAERFTAIFNNDSSSSPTAPYLAAIPGYGRTLSGVTLLPYITSSLEPNSSTAPKLSYDFYTFTPNVSQANVTVYMGMALNTHPERPLRYAVAVSRTTSSSRNTTDASTVAQIVQPVPSSAPNPLPEPFWSNMVSNAVMTNTTTHDMSDPGAYRLDLWILEPGLVVQKVVVDLGGIRRSYLGPPQSMRI